MYLHITIICIGCTLSESSEGTSAAPQETASQPLTRLPVNSISFVFVDPQELKCTLVPAHHIREPQSYKLSNSQAPPELTHLQVPSASRERYVGVQQNIYVTSFMVAAAGLMRPSTLYLESYTICTRCPWRHARLRLQNLQSVLIPTSGLPLQGAPFRSLILVRCTTA